MAKDPTPRADALRAQREARYGHLQATIESCAIRRAADEANKTPAPKAQKLAQTRKLIPYAGKASKGIAPKGPRTEAKKARQRVKRKRRTELPPEGAET